MHVCYDLKTNNYRPAPLLPFPLSHGHMSLAKMTAPWESGDATPEPKLTWNQGEIKRLAINNVTKRNGREGRQKSRL